MEILAIPKVMTEKEAVEIARNGGNFVGKILFAKKDIKLKLMYLESKEIIYRIVFEDSKIKSLLGKKREKQYGQKVRILVEGTRCTPAFLEENLKLENIEIKDKNLIQKTEFTNEKIINEGKFMARRMIRRQIGKTVLLEVENIRSIYRPYYIAFYGEMVEGTKVRYLPIPADGNQIRRDC